MPEQIRLKVGGVNSQRMIVYDVFARNIPGFLPLSDRDTALFIPKPVSVSIPFFQQLTYLNWFGKHMKTLGHNHQIIFIMMRKSYYSTDRV